MQLFSSVISLKAAMNRAELRGHLGCIFPLPFPATLPILQEVHNVRDEIQE